MKVPMANRLAPLSTGIFAELAAEKRRLLKAGRDVIDLSVGSPDLPPPRLILDKMATYVANPDLYSYSISGIEAFQHAAASFYQARYGVSLDPQSEVLQLAGTQEGLSHLPLAMLNEGDVALVPNPGYPIYETSVRLAGATPYSLPLREERNFLPDFDAIPGDILERTKLMILNYPGNPVTALADRSFFEEVVTFARRHHIFVVHDFAYSELVFDGIRPISFLAVPGAKEVGVEFNSLSKTFNMAGCRVGYICGNAEGIARLSMLKSHMDFGNFLPIQWAAVDALTAPSEVFEAQLSEYVKRRDALRDGLAEAGWTIPTTRATMFVWARIPAAVSSREFAFSLLREAGVACTPGDAFGSEGEGYVRMALVHSVEKLQEAAHRVSRFLESTVERTASYSEPR
jgi:LL-diaminopimelate aminotransferase